jgi:hypothetical protein
MVRAKFRLQSVKQYEYGGKQFEFVAAYDDGIEENRRFSKATPSGSLLMTVDNPPAAEFFELGKSYYLDFSKAE